MSQVVEQQSTQPLDGDSFASQQQQQQQQQQQSQSSTTNMSKSNSLNVEINGSMSNHFDNTLSSVNGSIVWSQVEQQQQQSQQNQNQQQNGGNHSNSQLLELKNNSSSTIENQILNQISNPISIDEKNNNKSIILQQNIDLKSDNSNSNNNNNNNNNHQQQQQQQMNNGGGRSRRNDSAPLKRKRPSYGNEHEGGDEDDDGGDYSKAVKPSKQQKQQSTSRVSKRRRVGIENDDEDEEFRAAPHVVIEEVEQNRSSGRKRSATSKTKSEISTSEPMNVDENGNAVVTVAAVVNLGQVDNPIPDKDGEIINCVCRQTHEDDFMICCDLCSAWLHGSCVGIGNASLAPTTYHCPKCSNGGVGVGAGVVKQKQQKQEKQQKQPKQKKPKMGQELSDEEFERQLAELEQQADEKKIKKAAAKKKTENESQTQPIDVDAINQTNNNANENSTIPNEPKPSSSSNSEQSEILTKANRPKRNASSTNNNNHNNNNNNNNTKTKNSTSTTTTRSTRASRGVRRKIGEDDEQDDLFEEEQTNTNKNGNKQSDGENESNSDLGSEDEEAESEDEEIRTHKKRRMEIFERKTRSRTMPVRGSEKEKNQPTVVVDNEPPEPQSEIDQNLQQIRKSSEFAVVLDFFETFKEIKEIGAIQPTELEDALSKRKRGYDYLRDLNLRLLKITSKRGDLNESNWETMLQSKLKRYWQGDPDFENPFSRTEEEEEELKQQQLLLEQQQQQEDVEMNNENDSNNSKSRRLEIIIRPKKTVPLAKTYKQIDVVTKISMLRWMCDMCLDSQHPFQDFFHSLDPEEEVKLRGEPLGNDKDGNFLWKVSQNAGDPRVFRETPPSWKRQPGKSWKLIPGEWNTVCLDHAGISKFASELGQTNDVDEVDIKQTLETEVLPLLEEQARLEQERIRRKTKMQSHGVDSKNILIHQSRPRRAKSGNARYTFNDDEDFIEQETTTTTSISSSKPTRSRKSKAEKKEEEEENDVDVEENVEGDAVVVKETTTTTAPMETENVVQENVTTTNKDANTNSNANSTTTMMSSENTTTATTQNQ